VLDLIGHHLMESRTIAGPGAPAPECRTLPATPMWPSKDFFRPSVKEQRTRHSKYNDISNNLEPNASIPWRPARYPDHSLLRHAGISER
jgi:UTP:GlnB (protein PII) uridylyltransferase